MIVQRKFTPPYQYKKAFRNVWDEESLKCVDMLLRSYDWDCDILRNLFGISGIYSETVTAKKD